MGFEIEEKWMKRIKFGAWAFITIVTTALSLWAAANSHFAIADDVVAEDTKINKELKATKEEIKAQKMSTEESMLEINIDIIEDRIDRAEKKTGDARDQAKIDKLKRRLNRVELRRSVLEEIRLKKEAGDGK